jgi:hypothetical protein
VIRGLPKRIATAIEDVIAERESADIWSDLVGDTGPLMT